MLLLKYHVYVNLWDIAVFLNFFLNITFYNIFFLFQQICKILKQHLLQLPSSIESKWKLISIESYGTEEEYPGGKWPFAGRPRFVLLTSIPNAASFKPNFSHMHLFLSVLQVYLKGKRKRLSWSKNFPVEIEKSIAY